MHPQFAEMVDSLHPSFERMMAMVPVTAMPPPLDTPKRGVYLFSEDDKHMYVGRSNRIRERYFLHCRPGSKHNQASFAFKLAREATGKVEATYRKGLGRNDMILEEPFRLEFEKAKARIRGMSYRYVEEENQTRQALLEIYASVLLATPYNDFSTH